MYKYVEKYFPTHEVHLVYVAGYCGFSTAHYFLNLGWNVIVVNPADVEKGDKERYQKTDTIYSPLPDESFRLAIFHHHKNQTPQKLEHSKT